MSISKQKVRIKTVEINELNRCFAEWDVVDETGSAIPLVNVGTLTLTLYDDVSGALVNPTGRPAGQDILNTAGGTYAATSGHVTFQFDSDDMAILGSWQRGRRESHTALFELTWGSTGYWSGEIKLLVANMQRVGSP